MALSEQTVISKIEILEDGQMQVRHVTRILRDGVVVSELAPHRYVLEPGTDVSAHDARVQTAAAAFWTPEVVQAFTNAKQQREAKPGA